MSEQVHPELPPQGFNPSTATEDDLHKYGFPPRPDATELQYARALWDDTISAVQEYAPADLSDERFPGKLLSPTWSGAILDPPTLSPVLPPPRFFSISSYWIIPNAYPPTCQSGGDYRCYSFVAFDGWQDTSPDPPALALGTKSVVRDGNHFAKVFLQVNGEEYNLCLRVMPGDLVTAHLWVIEHSNPPRFGIFLVNRNTGKATRARFRLPDAFKGKTAEWILARQNINYGQPGVATETLPNYGATFYHNTCALAYQGIWPRSWPGVRHFTVDQARLIDMVRKLEGKGGSDEVISTAEHIKQNVLLVYAYNDEQRRRGVYPLGRIRSSE